MYLMFFFYKNGKKILPVNHLAECVMHFLSLEHALESKGRRRSSHPEGSAHFTLLVCKPFPHSSVH